MTILSYPLLQEIFCRTLDRVQAYTIVCQRNNKSTTHNEELDNATLLLYNSANGCDIGIRGNIETVNNLLDELMHEMGLTSVNEINSLVRMKRTKNMESIMPLEAERVKGTLNDIVTLLKDKSDIKATQTENNRFEKVHTCLTCSIQFTSTRKDSKYCSPRCKQIAYREKKNEAKESTTPTTVVHCKRDKYDIYIGRANPRSGLKASKWKNPFPLPKDATEEQRAACIEKYKQWFFTQPELITAIPELKGKVLGCWCKPKACHGDFLAEQANKSN